MLTYTFVRLRKVERLASSYFLKELNKQNEMFDHNGTHFIIKVNDE